VKATRIKRPHFTSPGGGKLRSDPVSGDQLFGIAPRSAGSLVKIMAPEKQMSEGNRRLPIRCTSDSVKIGFAYTPTGPTSITLKELAAPALLAWWRRPPTQAGGGGMDRGAGIGGRLLPTSRCLRARFKGA
jgi:hypothetical protein